jgi:tetratricopeptide (TPR) repeat protein
MFRFLSILLIFSVPFLGGCNGKSSSGKGTKIKIAPSTTGATTTVTTPPKMIAEDPKKSSSKGADEELPAGIQLDDNASKQARLGLNHFMKGEETEAFEAWKTALDQDPKDSNSLYCMAQYYWDNGEEDDAKELFRKLFDANPSTNLKRQVGRIFGVSSVDSYDKFLQVLTKKESLKEAESLITDKKNEIKNCEMEIKNAERRERYEQMSSLQSTLERLKAELLQLEEQKRTLFR